MIGEADPFIARLLKRDAAESGLQTVVAPVGEDIVESARQVKPAVVIVEAELQKAEVGILVDEVDGPLQEPELLFEDLETALRVAGVEAGWRW